ncbi:hypothetical protein [Streptomyces sp. NBC_00063]|uniref:hypothetical protein n=1 Tax=Streptomyces sp. NBC_00063 TaxID=2975638 RepID=UPI003D73E5FE
MTLRLRPERSSDLREPSPGLGDPVRLEIERHADTDLCAGRIVDFDHVRVISHEREVCGAPLYRPVPGEHRVLVPLGVGILDRVEECAPLFDVLGTLCHDSPSD